MSVAEWQNLSYVAEWHGVAEWHIEENLHVNAWILTRFWYYDYFIGDHGN